MKIHVPDEFVTVNPDGSLDIDYLGEEIHVPADKVTWPEPRRLSVDELDEMTFEPRSLPAGRGEEE